MIRVIKEYESRFPFIRSYESLPREAFLGLMAACKVMIGNSSSGLAEAPSLRIPVVNIGTRQTGRIHAKNIIDVFEYDADNIAKAVKKALGKEFKEQIKNCVNPYGDGKTGPRIARILSESRIDARMLQKRLSF
jgi:UDP-N-acetylglucosamine 2-epimerase